MCDREKQLFFDERTTPNKNTPGPCMLEDLSFLLSTFSRAALALGAIEIYLRCGDSKLFGLPKTIHACEDNSMPVFEVFWPRRPSLSMVAAQLPSEIDSELKPRPAPARLKLFGPRMGRAAEMEFLFVSNKSSSVTGDVAKEVNIWGDQWVMADLASEVVKEDNMSCGKCKVDGVKNNFTFPKEGKSEPKVTFVICPRNSNITIFSAPALSLVIHKPGFIFSIFQFTQNQISNNNLIF